MTKTMRRIVAGLLALGLVFGPGQAFAQYYFWWQVVDEFGRPYPSQTVSCSVYELASHGAAELFLQPSLARHVGVLTSMPLLSDNNSRLHFYSAISDDKRVVCYYARGGAATDVRVSRTVHTIMIDRQGRRVARFQFVTNATNQSTNVWIPEGSIIRDVLVQNLPGSQSGDRSAFHLNVGFRGNHMGATYHAFVNQMHLGDWTEGTWMRPGVRYTVTNITGRQGQFFHFTASHRGQSLALFRPGEGSVADFQAPNPGTYIERPFVVHMAGGIELSYQTSNTVGISGHVFVLYDTFHAGGVLGTPVYQ